MRRPAGAKTKLSRRAFGPQRQRGFVLVVGLIASLLVIASFVVSISSIAAQDAAQTRDRDRDSYIETVLAGARQWYETNAAAVDATASTLDPASVLGQAVGIRKFGVRLAISERQGLPCLAGQGFSTCVPFRVIAVWLPPESGADTSAMDSATGAFTPAPGAVWRVYSGRAYQLGIAKQASDQLATVARAIQAWAAAKSAALPVRQSEINFFRAANCSAVQAYELPCIDVYTAAGATTLPATLGITLGEMIGPWGGQIEVSNLVDSSTAASPFSMSLRVTAPWGTGARLSVIQSL